MLRVAPILDVDEHWISRPDAVDILSMRRARNRRLMPGRRAFAGPVDFAGPKPSSGSSVSRFRPAICGASASVVADWTDGPPLRYR